MTGLKVKIRKNRKLYGHVEIEREVQAAMERKQDFKTEVQRDGRWVKDGNAG